MVRCSQETTFDCDAKSDFQGDDEKCEKGAARSIMLADVQSAFLHGDARRSLHVELHPDDHTSVSLNAPCMELATPR